jgi:hypothetical protein
MLAAPKNLTSYANNDACRVEKCTKKNGSPPQRLKWSPFDKLLGRLSLRALERRIAELPIHPYPCHPRMTAEIRRLPHA